MVDHLITIRNEQTREFIQITLYIISIISALVLFGILVTQ